MSIKIAIVDDHPLLIKGLQSMLQLNPDMEITGTYFNGKDLLQGIALVQPDVLLLDIQMPGQNGEELAALLHQQYPGIMILVLTHMEHEYYIKAMIQHGIMGYILKSSDERILLEAIRAAARGQHYFDPMIRKQATRAQQSVNQNPLLTRREKEILELIVLNHNSNEIASKLFLSKRTVDRHRENLLLKLDARNFASLVKKAIDLGLIR